VAMVVKILARQSNGSQGRWHGMSGRPRVPRRRTPARP
jgi:hypothetical protein